MSRRSRSSSNFLPLSGDLVGSNSKSVGLPLRARRAKVVIDDLLVRYVEALLYQAVAEERQRL